MANETISLKELPKYLLAGSSSAFLLWIAMMIYGDMTATQYAVLMTGIYFVVGAVGVTAIAYLVGKDGAVKQ